MVLAGGQGFPKGALEGKLERFLFQPRNNALRRCKDPRERALH